MRTPVGLVTMSLASRAVIPRGASGRVAKQDDRAVTDADGTRGSMVEMI